MDVLCVMQPWVVEATRPNIYDQEHTIMNKAPYGRSAQRIHGPVSSPQTGHSPALNASLCAALVPLACVAAALPKVRFFKALLIFQAKMPKHSLVPVRM